MSLKTLKLTINGRGIMGGYNLHNELRETAEGLLASVSIRTASIKTEQKFIIFISRKRVS